MRAWPGTATGWLDVQPGLVSALVVALGGAAAVGSIVLVTTLLASRGGRSTAVGYVLGYLGSYTTIGLTVVAADADPAVWTSGDAGLVGPVVVLVVGLALVALGLRTALRPRSEPARADAGGWINVLDRATPVRTFGLGVVVAFVNVKNLALYLTAVAVLQASDLTVDRKLAGVPLVALTFCLAVFVPLAIDVVAPLRSERLLVALRRGIDLYGRRLDAWPPLVVGACFMVRGVRGSV